MALRRDDGTAAGLTSAAAARADAYGHQAAAYLFEGLFFEPRVWAGTLLWHVERCDRCAEQFDAAAAASARRRAS